MRPADISAAQKLLEGIELRARFLNKILPDLHTLAYDPHVGEHTRSGTRLDWYLDEQGQQEAKKILAALVRDAHLLAKKFETHYAQVSGLLTGPSPNRALRGTTLGDAHGHGAGAELANLLRQQKSRKANGEYTPFSTEEQPEIHQR